MNKRFRRRGLFLSPVLTCAILLSGCGDSNENFVFTNTPGTPIVILAPVAVNDTYNALGNATVNIAAANGVLSNDTVNGGQISNFDPSGDQGGSVTLNDDGSFTYTPVFGFVGAETFNYTLSNGTGDSTATVTMTSTGRGFFVDNTAAPGGNGSQASPFNTLAAGIAASASGDTIFVSRGNGTSTGLAGAIALPPGVDLIGEGAGLVLAQTIVPAGQAPLLTGPITCGGNNTVSGLTIEGAATNAVIIDGVGNVTVSNNTINNPTNENIVCNDVTGTIVIDNNQLDDPTDNNDHYINLDNDSVNATVRVTNNTFTNDTNISADYISEFRINGSSNLTVTFSGNTANGAPGDQFEGGFYIDANAQSSVSFTIADNVMTEFYDYAVEIGGSDDGSIEGTISSNTFADCSSAAIDAAINDGTLNISNNNISDIDSNGIFLSSLQDGATFIIDNNTVSNCSQKGLRLYANDDGESKLAIRNNRLLNTALEAIDVNWAGNVGDLCCEVTGNTVENDISFLDLAGAGEIKVEQLNDLAVTAITGNILNNGAQVSAMGDVSNVDDGVCQIP